MPKTSMLPKATFQASKRQQAQLRRALDGGARIVVENPDGSRVASRELDRLLLTAMEELAQGEVFVLRGDEEVSPAEAGELLGLSRQFVDRLIDEGDLPARQLPSSRHRRIRVTDVVAFQQQRDQRRSLIASAVNSAVDAGAEY
jgi:excisionase family DNA binding protein